MGTGHLRCPGSHSHQEWHVGMARFGVLPNTRSVSGGGHCVPTKEKTKPKKKTQTIFSDCRATDLALVSNVGLLNRNADLR